MKTNPKIVLVVLSVCVAALLAGPAGAVTLLSPNGGETLESGGQWFIQWSASTGEVSFKIHYSLDNGATWVLIPKPYDTNSSHQWNVPVVNGNKEKTLLRVSAFDSKGNKIGSDRSDLNLKIDVIDVGTPHSGDNLISGSEYPITWDTFATKGTVAKVDLHYTTDNGTTWTKITSITGNPGSHPWTAPDVSKSKPNSRVRVTLKNSSGTILGKDTSSGTFTLAPSSSAGANISSKGVMQKGSLILSGITFTVPSSGTIRIDDNPGTESELQDGMVVKVRGKKFDDVSGTADKIEAENEVQGSVENLNVLALPAVFEILLQKIYVDDLTIFSNFPAPNKITSMANGQFVEVHGERDLNGNIRASRVELLGGVGDPNPDDFEVKGIVLSKVGALLTVGPLAVDATSATFLPLGVTLNHIKVGTPIEAKGSSFDGSTLIASIVEHEDIEDAEFEPHDGDDFEVEGYITDFTTHPGTFLVDDRKVQTTAATLFVDGSSLDLMNDIKVEAEGHPIGIVLVAQKITFKRPRVRIEAVASALTANGLVIQLAGGDSFAMLLTDLTDTSHATLALTVGSRYEMRGYVSSTGNIIAERIDDASSGGGGRDVFQAQVTARTGDVLTMLGISVDTSTVPDSEFRDADDNAITRAAFLAAAVPGKVVKVRDDDPNGTWDKAEIKN
ncbi:MAG: DUF5666 domain-containing protein [Desulfobacterales bacterium]|nr:DUF5666 domain-containing protein [Desulfobacterales bacterium]